MFGSKKKEEIKKLKEELDRLTYHITDHVRNTDELLAIEDLNREFFNTVTVEQYSTDPTLKFNEQSRSRVKDFAIALGFGTRIQADGALDLNEYVYGFGKLMFDLGKHTNSTETDTIPPVEVLTLYTGLMQLGALPIIKSICTYQSKITPDQNHNEQDLVLEFFSRNKAMFYYYDGRYQSFVEDYGKVNICTGLSVTDVIGTVGLNVPDNQKRDFVKLMRDLYNDTEAESCTTTESLASQDIRM